MYCSRVARYNDGQKDKKLSLGMLKVQYMHTISYIVHKYSLNVHRVQIIIILFYKVLDKYGITGSSMDLIHLFETSGS